MAGVAAEDVKVLSDPLNPFVIRVLIALRLKRVEYEFMEVQLAEPKSEILVKSNPVYKMVPCCSTAKNLSTSPPSLSSTSTRSSSTTADPPPSSPPTPSTTPSLGSRPPTSTTSRQDKEQGQLSA
ncbi:hypothetical protein ZIOFF_061059 [Zingiber officinale]|uniref:Glutathione S-transferase n=1 Tax=Zingiber officinale TaxID=94328 RepID=A0A8J5KLI5_ZINOF|nr:hypothetical protein ZIOFF_061059 [Zingiber officinale]